MTFDISEKTKKNLEVWGIIFTVLAALTTIAFNLYRLNKELKEDEQKSKMFANSNNDEQNVEFLGIKF